MLRLPIAAAAALSIVASPVLAQASSAPVDSAARAGATTEDASQLDFDNGGWFPAALFATIVVLGILMATGVLWDDDDESLSP